MTMVKKQGAPATRRKNDFDLHRYVPYLLNFVGGRIAIHIAQDLHRHRLKYRMWRVLLTLRHYGALNLVEMAPLANFDLSTLFRVVIALEGKKLVVRDETARVGRSRPVSLTPKGEQLVANLLPLGLEHEARAMRGLSARERATLVALLQKLEVNVTRTRPKTRRRTPGPARRSA